MYGDLSNAKYIEVSAAVRYWEDASVNGICDDDGQIPFRSGDVWKPIINLETGHVDNWPENTEADIYYKVCDAGEYWLLDEDKKRIAKWKGYYVPNDFLCVGENGFGDYIILNIKSNGLIEDWKKPYIDEEQWMHDNV